MQHGVLHDDAAQQGFRPLGLVFGRQGIYGADQRPFLNAHEVEWFQVVKHGQVALKTRLPVSCLSAVITKAG